jgi:hypothetical protein
MQHAAQRKTTTLRLDPVDREALRGEQRRRAKAGEVVDVSALVREAIRRVFLARKGNRAPWPLTGDPTT